MLVECPRGEEVQDAICARNKREERGEGQPWSSEVTAMRRWKHGLSGTHRSERNGRTVELANFELEEKRRESIDHPTENPSDKNQSTSTKQSTNHKTRIDGHFCRQNPCKHATTVSNQQKTASTDR
jgi:hypothetical protein